jgi:hypothetical protein
MRIFAAAVCCMSILGSACSSQNSPESAQMQCLTGQPVFKGNAPFQRLHLRTANGLYALEFETSSAADFQAKLAARQNLSTQICGRLQPASPPLPETLLVLQIKIPANP